MKIDSKDFRVPPGKGVDLSKWPTIVDPYYKSTKKYKELLFEHMEKLSSLQQLLYASNRHALLLIFQGMDGAGKDGAIRHVMSGVNPEGCGKKPQELRQNVTTTVLHFAIHCLQMMS